MRYFKLSEFACKCGQCESDGSEMQTLLLGKIDALRGRCGFPFIVSSGYRCPDHNERVSSTGRDGPHTTGQAVDIKVYGRRAQNLIAEAMRQGGWTGLGVNQKGAHGSRFIHLDTLLPPDNLRPRVWSY